MTGYVRKDTSNNIADGNIINASDLDAEFDGVQDAFNASTGHTHDGSSGEGAPITKLGPAQDVVVGTGAVTPKTTNTVDIGSSSLKFKDLWLAGNANVAGTTTLGGALTYGGVTLSNAVTGTGNMVLSASPTLTGTLTAAAANFSGAVALNGNSTLGDAVGDTVTVNGTATFVNANPTLSAGTANGVAYLNASKVLTTGSALQFDGTSLGIGIGPSYRLDVLAGAGSVNIFRAGQIGISNGYAVTTNGTTLTHAWANTAGVAMTLASNNLTVNAGNLNVAGSIGVNAASPSAPLDIRGGTNVLQARFGGVATRGLEISTTLTGGTNDATSILDARGSGSGNLVLQTDSVERLRINQSGNVGIGTTSPITTSARLSVKAAGDYDAGLAIGSNASAANWARLDFKNTNAANSAILYQDSVGTFAIRTDGAYPITFLTNGANERMRIDSSGNVGIGTSSPAYKLDVSGVARLGGGVTYAAPSSTDILSTAHTILNGTGGNYLSFGQYPAAQNFAQWIQSSFQNPTTATYNLVLQPLGGNVGIGTSSPRSIANYVTLGMSGATGSIVDFFTGSTRNGIIVGDNQSLTLRTVTALPIVLGTNDTERARITSGGEVYIAGTTDQGAYNLQVNGTGVWGAGAYVNGSDTRLKENVQTLTDGLSVVTQLRPVTFQYKAEYSKDTAVQPGFIAQELQQAMAGKDYVDGVVQAGPEYLNVAYQSLIPVLTKAIQEQQAQIEQLRAEIQTLKGN